ncbi:hypothetical protein SAY86_024000 [Trapa natans]|uniref:Uncharacterized protein n=1 Tax=Trapa natans TaxID=22666 RepID=A0AAN7R9U7_TRANT|nr:hypothetical protein SAY86_024000 [Trapa natans]
MYVGASGLPDETRAAQLILKDYTDWKLPHYPGIGPKESGTEGDDYMEPSSGPAKKQSASHNHHKNPQRKKDPSWRVGNDDGDGMPTVRVFQNQSRKLLMKFLGSFFKLRFLGASNHQAEEDRGLSAILFRLPPRLGL